MDNQGRILIADDEETFLFSTADLLRKEGYTCDCVRESKQAQKLLKANPYDLLIADIRMPGNVELEFIHELPTLAAGLPVILVTAHPSLQSAIESVQLPVIAYLVKPIDFDELISQVRFAVGRSRIKVALQEARQQLIAWQKELGGIIAEMNEKTNNMAAIPVEAFLVLTFQNIVNSLNNLRNLTVALSEIRGQKEVCLLLNCPRTIRLTAGLRESIRVLEKTKASFKSKDLFELRKKLEALLKFEEEWAL
ncbi:MAG: response regulator [bacterium]